MDDVASAKERERAYQAFRSTVESFKVALQAVNLVATSPELKDQLTAQIVLNRGMRDLLSDGSAERAADLLVRFAVGQREDGYESLRRATLIAACGALEYLVKAVLVDQASLDPERAAGLLAGATVKPKITLDAAEVLGLPMSEQWLLVADRLFEALGASQPLMHLRMVQMLKEHCHLPHKEAQVAEIDGILDSEERRAFNEAYLVRNCLVHNGGRVSAALSRYLRSRRGDLVRLDRAYTQRLLLPLEKMADGVNMLKLLPL